MSPIPVTNWNETVIDGKRYLVIDVAKLRVPLEWDPSSNVFIAVAAPTGGVLDYPALVQGDDGAPPDIDNDIDFTELDPDDPTAAFASWTETGPNAYKLTLGMHGGTKGDDGDNVLDPSDYGTPLPGKMLVVDAPTTGFTFITPKVGDWYYPVSYNNIGSGNPTATLTSVSIPAQDFAWRPFPVGQALITGTGADVAVDLLCRLGHTGITTPETAGNIVGRAIGSVGVSPPAAVISAGRPPPPTGNDAYDTVDAGLDAIIYLRAERRTGADTFTVSGTNTTFKVKVDPIP